MSRPGLVKRDSFNTAPPGTSCTRAMSAPSSNRQQTEHQLTVQPAPMLPSAEKGQAPGNWHFGTAEELDRVPVPEQPVPCSTHGNRIPKQVPRIRTSGEHGDFQRPTLTLQSWGINQIEGHVEVEAEGAVNLRIPTSRESRRFPWFPCHATTNANEAFSLPHHIEEVDLPVRREDVPGTRDYHVRVEHLPRGAALDA